MSGEQLNRESLYDKNFVPVKRMFDPRFGEVSLVQNPSNGNLAMRKEYSFQCSVPQFIGEINARFTRLKLNSDGIIQFYDFSSSHHKTFCSEQMQIREFYYFPALDLQQEIQQRRCQMHLFTHQELLHLAYQLLHALYSFHKQLIGFQDLRPMFISVEYGTKHNIYKLIDRLKDTGDTLKANRTHLATNTPLYCSPSLFKAMFSPEHSIGNVEKNDLFSLGLCLLQAGTLDSIQDIFDTKTGNFVLANLETHVEHFKRNYKSQNSLLCKLLDKLLILEDAGRSVTSKLLTELPLYEEFLNKGYKEPEPLNIPLEQSKEEIRKSKVKDFGLHEVTTYDPMLKTQKLVAHHTYKETMGFQDDHIERQLARYQRLQEEAERARLEKVSF
jgi:serine/threonine protein kinase